MKYRLTFFLALIGFSTLTGQSFKLAEFQPLQIEDRDGTQTVTNYLQSVYLIRNETDTITSFEVDLFVDAEKSLTIRSTDKLENIHTVLKVDISQTGCCTGIDTHYYFITNEGKILEFTEIKNSQCDGPEPKYDLIFPEDEHGIENTIYLGRILYEPHYVNYKPVIKYVENICEISMELLNPVK